MANFFADLWSSIFTPGPTPTLLIATNATFGALQVLLFVLLLATYSIHFFILSFLCGSLWYAINWFAAEVKIAQAQQEEEERKKKAAQEPEELDLTANDTDDTEVEAGATRRAASKAIRERKTAGSASHEVEVVADNEGELKKRATATGDSEEAEKGASLAGTQSSVSTEDEWEKVSENEKDK